MEIGIKYCGGCNPQYNRSEWVKALMEEFSDVTFETASKDKYYDVVLIVNGCNSACASHEELKGKEKLFVKSEKDADRVIKAINSIRISSQAKS